MKHQRCLNEIGQATYLEINWLKVLQFLMNICKDTRKVVVKLHLQPQSEFLCLCMNTEWIEILGKCTSYLIMEALCLSQLLCDQLWDRKVFFHLFAFFKSQWMTENYKCALLKYFIFRVFLNYLFLMHIKLVLNGDILLFWIKVILVPVMFQ